MGVRVKEQLPISLAVIVVVGTGVGFVVVVDDAEIHKASGVV